MDAVERIYDFDTLNCTIAGFREIVFQPFKTRFWSRSYSTNDARQLWRTWNSCFLSSRESFCSRTAQNVVCSLIKEIFQSIFFVDVNWWAVAASSQQSNRREKMILCSSTWESLFDVAEWNFNVISFFKRMEGTRVICGQWHAATSIWLERDQRKVDWILWIPLMSHRRWSFS